MRRAVLVALAALPASSVVAAENYWMGTGSADSWFVPNSWSMGRLPAAGDDVNVRLPQNAAADAAVYYNGAPSVVPTFNTLWIDSRGPKQMTVVQDTAGSTMRANVEYIGQFNRGAYDHRLGTNIADTLYVGFSGPGASTYTLGAGGTVQAGALYVGYVGNGTFTQTGGAVNVSGHLRIADQSGSRGTYEKTGGSLAVAGSMILSNFPGGTGSFHTDGAGSLSANALVIQSGGSFTQDAGDSFFQSLTMAGGSLDTGFFAHMTIGGKQTSGGITVATQGTSASVNLLGGATVKGVVGNIGFGSGLATVNMTGAGTTWTTTQSHRIGSTGRGELNASGGAVINAWGGNVGAYAGSTGTATLSGPGTAWNNTDKMQVGGEGAWTGTACTLNLEDRAAVNAGGALVVWNQGLVNVKTGATMKVGGIDLRGGGRVVVHAGAKSVLETTGVTVDTANGSRLDVGDGAVVVNYATGATSPLAGVKQLIVTGRNGGTWNGNGITSGTAAGNAGQFGIGYGEASTILGLGGAATAQWLGRTVDATTVLVRQTLIGDATLDGKVSFPDLLALAKNYNQSPGAQGWAQGDFTYDGKVEFADLLALAKRYGGALPADVPGAGAAFEADLARAFASVPEPSVVGWVVGLGIMGMARRRRRA